MGIFLSRIDFTQKHCSTAASANTLRLPNVFLHPFSSLEHPSIDEVIL